MKKSLIIMLIVLLNVVGVNVLQVYNYILNMNDKTNLHNNYNNSIVYY